jgi:hypothetical protein
MVSKRIAELERLVKDAPDFAGSYYGDDIEFHVSQSIRNIPDIDELVDRVFGRRRNTPQGPIIRMHYHLVLDMDAAKINSIAGQGLIKEYHGGGSKPDDLLMLVNLMERAKRYEEMGAAYICTLAESDGITGDIVKMQDRDKYSLVLHSCERKSLLRKGKAVIEAVYE